MRCRRFRRWLSDDIDGRLPDREKKRLEFHLDVCSACRAYQKDLARLQAECGSIDGEPVGTDYFEKFAAAVETRLRQETVGDRRRRTVVRRWIWVWTSVPVLLALVLGLILLRNRGENVREEIFSFEACLERVYQEIGEDDDFAADFSRFLSGSLVDQSEAMVLEDNVDLWKEPFFWRSLNDEDLRLIEEEIKKGIRS
jgi:hypothetical protein